MKSLHRSLTHRLHTLRESKLTRAFVSFSVLLCTVLVATGQIPNKSKPLPLGTLVNVGGYRVHLYCSGHGSPTVMIVGAAFSFDWGLVQPQVAKFTKVCTFDPSGTTWSDPFKDTTTIPTVSDVASVSRSIPTCADRVDEIHRLITRAPVDGPYVLVGFSVGALWERLYAAKYPENILGMVIVDHAFLPADRNNTSPPPTDSNASRRGYSPPVLISKAPMNIGFEDDWNFSKLPRRDQELHTWALSQHPIRPDYKMATDCFSRLGNATEKQTYPLGNIALDVISTPNEAPGYAELQTKLLALSHDSKHIIAGNSSHMVPIDEPEVIINAIHDVVEDVRGHGTQSKVP